MLYLQYLSFYYVPSHGCDLPKNKEEDDSLQKVCFLSDLTNCPNISNICAASKPCPCKSLFWVQTEFRLTRQTPTTLSLSGMQRPFYTSTDELCEGKTRATNSFHNGLANQTFCHGANTNKGRLKNQRLSELPPLLTGERLDLSPAFL